MEEQSLPTVALKPCLQGPQSERKSNYREFWTPEEKKESYSAIVAFKEAFYSLKSDRRGTQANYDYVARWFWVMLWVFVT